ncbi:MAG: pirin family protein [Conexivisphaerales archaeon]
MLKSIFIIYIAQETSDGAGVRLKRVFGGMRSAPFTDPFLLLDNFGSTNPEEYIMGFPWHPHRGIETVTYLLDGKVEHEDSEGNRGVIYPNELQWMTAGSGIYHQEMPRPISREDGAAYIKVNHDAVFGFQLWINLPSTLKMSWPAYRSIKPQNVPVIGLDNGGSAKIIAGKYKQYDGAVPFSGNSSPLYMDIMLEPWSEFRINTLQGFKTIVYPFIGQGLINGVKFEKHRAYVLSEDGEEIYVSAGEVGTRFLLFAGRPIREQIAWYGPIVMNTQEQLEQAFADLRNGIFIKHKEPNIL